MAGLRSLRALPLAWRGALLATAAIGSLAVATSVTAFFVVRGSLQQTLQQELREDAARVAELYRVGAPGTARDQLAGPTGGVIVQLYDPMGALIIATEPRFMATDSAIDPRLLSAARDTPKDWRGELATRSVQAAMHPFEFGVVVVLGDTSFIGATLSRLGQALALATGVVVLLSALVGWAVAAATVTPIRRLARLAQRLGPDRLESIPDLGPRDEVGRLTAVLNDLIARLRGALDAQRAFLAETSHELRSPLTSLQGFLERASRRAEPAVRSDLDDARRVAAGMSRLVADLLQLSRGELVKELDPFLLDPVADVLRPVAEEFPGVGLEGNGGLMVLGDPVRLRQLLRNLVSNAVRLAGADGVTVRAVAEQDEVLIEVHDRGPGVPEELRQKVFEKFWTSGGGGTGLGLAIARQVAEAHGSELTLRSRPGDTTFSLRLARMELSDEEG